MVIPGCLEFAGGGGIISTFTGITSTYIKKSGSHRTVTFYFSAKDRQSVNGDKKSLWRNLELSGGMQKRKRKVNWGFWYRIKIATFCK